VLGSGSGGKQVGCGSRGGSAGGAGPVVIWQKNQ